MRLPKNLLSVVIFFALSLAASALHADRIDEAKDLLRNLQGSSVRTESPEISSGRGTQELRIPTFDPKRNLRALDKAIDERNETEIRDRLDDVGR